MSTFPRRAPRSVTALCRNDPAGAEGVILASWIIAELPGLNPEVVRDDLVRFQVTDDPTAVLSRLDWLMTERRFHGWRVSAADGDSATLDEPDTGTLH